ncbi:hypothetical protein PAXRUDRAFT_167374 [Paxillus rubicundulus Ve08.2h10]|uniref:Uncharacterized protein n=1 Tax=Paxillus rubicundulus Ve08.2h10 TaxID=930991 RepID=A0A0D0C273_9AGAM|nr:hypothetical protein PAXRUDRAFT_167374 [Paxillus rubicundulus Ve08.2h10]
MRPGDTNTDLPCTHDIMTFLHNSIVNFIKQLKIDIQSPATGCVSTMMDLWSVDQTKAAFFGLTAH